MKEEPPEKPPLRLEEATRPTSNLEPAGLSWTPCRCLLAPEVMYFEAARGESNWR